MKVILITLGKKERYFKSLNDGNIEVCYNKNEAMDFCNSSDEELQTYLEKIVEYPFKDYIATIQVVNFTDYEPEEFKIKQALSKLTNEEIILLGLEEIAFYHLLKKSNNEVDVLGYDDDGDDNESYEHVRKEREILGKSPKKMAIN